MNKIRWKIIGCALEGLDAMKLEMPCQDKIARYRDEKISVIALADGAGSADLSHFGAERVTKIICRLIAENFEKFLDAPESEIKSLILNELLQELQLAADEHECELKDLASTLMAAASDGEKYFMLIIGDGIAGIFKDGEINLAAEPYTVFVTSKLVSMHTKILRGALENINGFVLMSDGAADSFYERKTKTLIPWLNDIAKECSELPEDEREKILLSDFETIIRPRTLDDCSMILMCREDWQ